MAALAKVMIVEASSSTFEHEGYSASFLTASRASWRSPPFVVSSFFVVSLEDVRVSLPAALWPTFMTLMKKIAMTVMARTAEANTRKYNGLREAAGGWFD